MGDEVGIKKAARYAHAAWFENAPASTPVADKDQLTGSSGFTNFLEEMCTRLREIHVDDERRSLERRQLVRNAEEDELDSSEIQARMDKMGVFMLASSRRIAVKNLLPLYYTREDVEQVFDITKGYAKALLLNVQSIDTFRGHLLMVFISTIILRLLQRALAKTPYSLDDVMSVMRNQKAKVFDEFLIPIEPTKKQNEIYKLVGVKPELSITRQGCQ